MASGLPEQIKNIAEFVEEHTPQMRKYRLVINGIILAVGISLGAMTVALINHDWEKRQYGTYVTFYLLEKGGVRPASTVLNFPLKTEADLDAAETHIYKKYDNGKLLGVMLFGCPIVIEKRGVDND